MNKKEILDNIEILKKNYGDWTYDIPLPYNIWTKGNLGKPHTRLKRIIQIVKDTINKPLNQCKILDLGCLDGLFSIEFAKHGAQTTGIEIREANIKKAIFCKKALKLNNLKFIQDDARNISTEILGTYDAIICSGLFYHLTIHDAIELAKKMYKLSNKIVIIDTHIALKKALKYDFKNNISYYGISYIEHNKNESQEEKAKKLWASWDNEQSFIFTRPSLINLLSNTGFSSVYECFTPAHMNFGNSGIQFDNRCTFVAIKGNKQNLFTSPSVNSLVEQFPENSLSYMNNEQLSTKKLLQILSKRFFPRNFPFIKF